MKNDNTQHFQQADTLLRKGDPDSVALAFALLTEVTAREPQNAKAWFELAGAFDFLGREAEALPYYEKTLSFGIEHLPEEDRPRLYVQLGSTLRNLKKNQESKTVIQAGLEKFPRHAALTAFLGLTEYSNGRFRNAAKHFLNASLPESGDTSIADYARALRFYRDQLDTYPARQRNWMRIYLHDRDDPGSGFPAAPITIEHAPSLARLMDVSYRGTIDHEGETIEQCLGEMKNTIEGKYGPFLGSESFVAMIDNKAVAASMITLWKEEPLLAFSMTDPDQQGRGLAGFLIRKSLRALHLAGHKVLYLVVTEGNSPAERLYRKIGFEFLGPAIPGQGFGEAET